jgi:hypothetical protein
MALTAGCVGGAATVPTEDTVTGENTGTDRGGRGDEGEGKGPPAKGPEEGALQGQILSVYEMMIAAKDAGLPCDALVVAGAVGMGESEGDPNAIHYNDPSGDCPNGSRDRGLWQINDCYWGDLYDDACSFDPACNAGAMAFISTNGSSWQLWSAYTNGRYEMFLGAAEAAYAQGISGCSEGGGGTPPEPGSGSTPMTDCAALGYEGTCVGQVSAWYEGGACRIRDCGVEGKVCDWISDEAGWGCLGGPGKAPIDCSTLGYSGACMSDTLVWEDNDACHAVHCPSTGQSCVWVGGAVGYDCE